MHFKFLPVILIITISQGPSGVESLSLSDSIQDKLHSITQWLDSLKDASIFDYIYRVNRGVGLNLFEGDIKGYNRRHAQLRTAITNRQQLWNTRVIPYLIDSSFDSASRKDILAAIDEYHQKTCIRWIPRTSESDYVHFKQISGCFSNVGRTGGEQDISLMGACLKKGTAVHEMMHALGFWHEQSRPDRDSWVHIITGNIQDGKEYNFEKLDATEADTLGVQYDYGSVMHYSKYAFTKNGNPTIMPIRPTGSEIGQREGLSDHDVERITKLYGCNYPVPTTPAPTNPPTTKPLATKPPETKPTTTKPPETKPPTTKPPATKPPTTKPQETKPPTTKPPATKPPTTKPPETKPPTTKPPETKPPTTKQQETKPPTTKPQETKPPTTKPQETKPTTAVQKVSEPSTTKATTSQPVHTNPSTEPFTSKQPVSKSNPTTHKTSLSTLPPVESTHPQLPVYQLGWTLWSEWSPCDLQCKHSRYRFCLNYDRNYCLGENTQVNDCPYPCKSASTFGCWKQDGKQLTIPSVEGMDPELMDPYKGMHATGGHKHRTGSIRKCSNYASMMGYKMFAIFDGGQCLTGPDVAAQFSKSGASNKCSFNGLGSSESMNVFTFDPDIDGQWSVWTDWGRCTKTCGLGRQYRYRRCDNPPPIGNGAPCSGSDREVAVCNHGTCIVPIKCGSRYHAGGPGSSGIIWMREYENFMECEYEIATGDPFASISIYIHEIDIEYSKGCTFDTLMLFDGYNARAPLVGAFCGNSAPGTFESSSNYVFLKFTSDETKTGRGFTVFYSINSRTRKACSKPPPSAHASISMEGNMVGDRAWYNCNVGYKMVGHSPITCMDQPGFALWDDKFPRCVHLRKRSVTDGLETKCNFQDSLCGYRNEDSTDIKWTVKRFGEETSNVSLHGNILHAESTRINPSGALARVRTPIFNSASTAYCLNFLYKLDGGQFATFKVYLVASGTDYRPGANETSASLQGSDTVLVEVNGQDDGAWKQVSLTVEAEHMFQIIFEAVLGDEVGSSVSIDDVIVKKGFCKK